MIHLDVIAHTCDPSAQEVDAEGWLGVWGQSGLCGV